MNPIPTPDQFQYLYSVMRQTYPRVFEIGRLWDGMLSVGDLAELGRVDGVLWNDGVDLAWKLLADRKSFPSFYSDMRLALKNYQASFTPGERLAIHRYLRAEKRVSNELILDAGLQTWLIYEGRWYNNMVNVPRLAIVDRLKDVKSERKTCDTLVTVSKNIDFAFGKWLDGQMSKEQKEEFQRLLDEAFGKALLSEPEEYRGKLRQQYESWKSVYLVGERLEILSVDYTDEDVSVPFLPVALAHEQNARLLYDLRHRMISYRFQVLGEIKDKVCGTKHPSSEGADNSDKDMVIGQGKGDQQDFGEATRITRTDKFSKVVVSDQNSSLLLALLLVGYYIAKRG